jgi:hypothetical protein
MKAFLHGAAGEKRASARGKADRASAAADAERDRRSVA